MKKMTKFFALALFTLTIGLSSCGGDGAGGVGSRACTNAAESYTEAVSAFAADFDSAPKCEAFKAAWLNLLDNCGGLDYFGNQDAYDEAIAYVESFDCDAL
jgi:hypothetical protein